MKTNIQRIRDAFPALKWSLYREIQDGVDHVVIVLDSKVVGSTHLLLSPLELIEKLAALVPPPRLSLIRYHGVLAPTASARKQIFRLVGRHHRARQIVLADWQRGKQATLYRLKSARRRDAGPRSDWVETNAEDVFG